MARDRGGGAFENEPSYALRTAMDIALDLPADPLQAITHADPAPYYAALAAARPFHYDAALGWWIAASAAAVDAVLGHTACTVRPADEPAPRHLAASPTGAFFGRLVRQIDGPDHGARRAALLTALGRLDVSSVAAQAHRLAKMALPDATALAPALADAMHLRIPLETLAHALLGDDADAAACRQDIAAYLAALSPDAPAGAIHRADTAVARLSARFATAPLAAHADEALVANLAGLLAQTHDACAGLLGNAVVALARRPGLAGHLRTRPHAIDPFLYEVLRLDAPVQNTRRFVSRDTALCGESLRAGDRILVLLAAANVDTSANPDPLRFDLARAPRRVWTFGAGAHRCPGESLAVAIARETVQHLLNLPGIDRWLAGVAMVRYQASPNARIPVFAPSHQEAP
ncbi:cytochrome P450 [Ralstonia solanacearum]|uniref:cytochrome P450 n=1 Tax=Ralstonia solanacearum TaxID=305 RepID=UPI0018D1EC15|nr:cytochrome P450 [Ralstonia solanacearum]